MDTAINDDTRTIYQNGPFTWNSTNHFTTKAEDLPDHKPKIGVIYQQRKSVIQRNKKVIFLKNLASFCKGSDIDYEELNTSIIRKTEDLTKLSKNDYIVLARDDYKLGLYLYHNCHFYFKDYNDEEDDIVSTPISERKCNYRLDNTENRIEKCPRGRSKPPPAEKQKAKEVFIKGNKKEFFLKLSSTAKEKNINYEDIKSQVVQNKNGFLLTEEDFIDMFPHNPSHGKILYKELKPWLLKRHNEITSINIARGPGRPPKPGSVVREPKKTGKIHQFILKLLNTKQDNYVVWQDKKNGIFRFTDSQGIARHWGRMRGRSNFTYEHFSRAIRYHYNTSKCFRQIDQQRLVYGFGPAMIEQIKDPEHIDSENSEE